MNTALAQATVAWLLTYALHSTIVLSATWLTLRSRRFAPAIADVAWKAALVGGIVTATLQGLAERRPAGTLFLGAPLSSAADANHAALAQGEPSVAHEAAGEGLSSASRTSAASRIGAAEAENVGRSTPVGADAVVGTVSRDISSVAVLAGLWFFLAIALIGWYVGRRLVLVGRLGDRRPVVDGATLALLEELRRDSRARAALRLTSSATISSPLALSGEICLPAAAIAELEPAQLRAMLAHELAHLERRDPMWLAFACIVERAFFFQPLNRLARRGLQESAEYLADEWAARHSGGVSLAKALVRVAEWMQASPLGVPVAGFAEERSQLTARVTRLLEGVARTPTSRWGAVAFAAAMLSATTAFAPGVSQTPAPRPVRTPTPARSPSPAPAPASAPMPAPGPAPMPAPDRLSLPDGLGARPPLPVGAESGSERAAFADTAIVRAVMLRLRDESAEVRRAAADALGRMRHPMAIDALVIALDDLDGEVRRAALFALGSFERARVPAPPLRRMLENADAEMRSHAVRMLAEQRDRAAIPAITRLLADPEEEVRGAALQALAELEAPIPEEVLTRAFSDRASDVRHFAAMVAGDRQLVTLVPQLVKLLEDRSGDVREQAAHALTEMRTPAAHEALRKALTHRDASVRRVAVEYFGTEVDK